MEFLLKLVELLKTYPWRYFGLTVSLLCSGFMLLAIINHKKVDKWLQKLKLTFSVGRSGTILMFSITIVLFFMFFSYNWITQVGLFNAIENYLINFIFLLTVSLVFGIIAYLIHLAIAMAYKLDNINEEDYYQSSTETLACRQVLAKAIIAMEKIAFGDNYWQSVLKSSLIDDDDFLIDFE